MYDCTRHYINGEWVNSTAGTLRDIINPATETSIGTVCLGTAEDVDAAVAAARSAFESFSTWTRGTASGIAGPDHGSLQNPLERNRRRNHC